MYDFCVLPFVMPIPTHFAFKNHLIDPSNRLSSWVEGGDCCEWIGVVCHNSTGPVHQLNLAPTLSEPDEFAPYFELEAYERSKLGGKINPSLLELKHLAGFPAGIPHNLGNLSKLHYLDLGGNYLKPKSLQWVSGLSSLQYLDLSGANLSKANDWLQVTFKHPSLLELLLSNCGLEDDPSPISVNSTKSLVILDLFGNAFSSVPKSIFSLHGLMSFYLNENSLEGPIPDYFGNISFLEVLDLTLNHLNSSIPNSLYSLNRLQFLGLSENQLQGTISSSIGNLSSITHLDLSSNFMLEGRLPTSLEYLCKLKEMDLSYNKIEDGISEILQRSLFESVCNSPSWEGMEVLYIDKNLISGEIPDCWNHLQNLGLLNLESNNLTGKIPPSLGHINVSMLNLRNNSMFGALPSTLQNSSLIMLDFSENHFNGITGEIPKEIGSLIELRSLNLSGNLQAGNIPNKIGNMELMESLDLSMNRLNGEIPPSISNLNFLNHFNVS
ncbi:LRR receptor-like serine/threonine-protein kinase FLS2 [Gossypium australe]|uniref:LRR receptor-like serine/threonine-protein kinase FLS2 n=1 Tax=Gossypium australe TaxID=47621 RepID=A0A5B6VTG5_9ROSI|nr:LRR receptor-like serine/threonine-protein kinase FLS2 [Gossypium australe]